MTGKHRAARRRTYAAIAVAVAIALFLIPLVAFARAGGGQVGGGSSGGGFSGGSGSSGFSSSSRGYSSGGSGSPFDNPVTGALIIGISVVTALIVGLVVVKVARAMRNDVPAPPAAMPAAAVAELTSTDPEFTEQAFRARVTEMFMAIQNAWMARDLEPARRFLADAQFNILNASVQTDYIAAGHINKLDALRLIDMWPVAVTREGGYDSVTMLIEASVIDYTVDERTGEIVNPAELGDGTTPTTFREYWTFMRGSGAVSRAGATIASCPNCGAAVSTEDYVKCAYCAASMNDPTLDWVLVRIEQIG
ncbi:MAG: Tim44 domain-containing protein [Coriobacteriia bacterium]|nr:Tim44 domain-containing protein [Coriobacteriia bacterium]